MRLLVTRPEAEARDFAAALARIGVDAVVAPLTAIVPEGDAPLDLAGVQALLVTSVNGARALARRTARRDLPAFAVGEATARALAAAGFVEVRPAAGDGRALADLAAASLDPAKGALLWASGRDRAVDLDAALSARGFSVRRAVLYRAEAVAALPEAARAALAGDGLDGVALFSPRGAEILVARAAAAGLAGRFARLDAFCLSAAIAAALARESERAAAPWRRIAVAERPETDSLLRLIRGTMRSTGGPSDMSETPKPDTAPQAADSAAEAAREAERIVAAFGGIRPMAKILGVPVTTVQGWKERGAIPIARLADVRAAAARAGIDLDAPPRAEARSDAPQKVETVAAERIVEPPKSGVRDADAGAGAAAGPARAAEPPPTVEARAASPGPDPGDSAGPPPPERNRPLWFGLGFGGAFAAGLVVAWLVGPVFGGRGGDAPSAAAVEARLRALQGQLDEANRRAQAEAQGLQQRLARIEANERALRDQSERLANVAAQATALATRLEQMDEALKRLAAGAPPNAEEMRALRDLVQRLAARVEALPPGGGDPAALARLTDSLRELDGRVAALDARVAQLAAGDPAKAAGEARALAEKLQAELAALRQAVATQSERLAALAAEARRAAAESDAPVVVAVGQLRAEAERGLPFRRSLDAVRALVKERPSFMPPLDALAPHADKGAKTLATLRRDFDRLGAAIQRAAERAAEGDWLDRAWARLRSLVVVRRTGENAGDGPGAVISRVEAALARGDLAAALAAFEKLPEAGRAAAGAWPAEARARLAVDAALAALDRLVLDLVAGARPGGAPAGESRGEPAKKP